MVIFGTVAKDHFRDSIFEISFGSTQLQFVFVRVATGCPRILSISIRTDTPWGDAVTKGADAGLSNFSGKFCVGLSATHSP